MGLNYINDRNAILALLQRHLSKGRIQHSLQVEGTAIQLAKRFSADINKAGLAGLLHDVSKEMDPWLLARHYQISAINEKTLHGPIAALWLREEELVQDADVLGAIAFHTTGRADMTVLEKIIYLADLTEPNRRFTGVSTLRNLSRTDLDRAMLYSLKQSIKHLLETDKMIEPNTIYAYNYFRKLETI